MKHLLSIQKDWKSIVVAGCTGFFLVICGSQSKANAFDLIQNGSFEYDATFVDDSRGGMSLQPGSTVIPFWTTTNAEIVWSSNNNNYANPGPLTTPFGNYSLDLTGYHDTPPYGGVTQWIHTIAGENYTLFFALGVYNGSNLGVAGPISVLVSAGATSQTFIYNSLSPGSQWGEFGLKFIAQNAYTPISFLGTFTQGGDWIALDNVSVKTAPVPEPLTIIGSGIALGFGGFLKRKLGKHQKD